MNRKEFLKTLAGATASTILGAEDSNANSAAAAQSSPSATTAPSHKIKRGVSLYSYQQAMMERGATLRDCLEEISDMGAYGFEFLMSLPEGYPNVPNQFIDKWWRMMDRFGTIPVTATYFTDSGRRVKPMTTEENLAFMERDFILLQKLGVKNARTLGPAWLLEAAFPMAEKYGICMGWEVHAPMKLKSPLIDWIIAKADKYPDLIGLHPDMGLFLKYPRPLARELQIRAGTLTRETALFIEDSYRKGMEKAEVASKVGGMKPKPGDTSYVEAVFRAGANYQNPKELIPLIKYIKHIHGKCNELTGGDEFKDTTIPYDEVIPVLMQNGYDGYIVTEFEGQRIGGLDDVDEFEQVRRHQVMLKSMLGV